MNIEVYKLFHELNQIPRPSHHEERVADFLCRFAEARGLKYRRTKENCVVIEKPATPGYEDAEPVVILNHMDMVCVGRPDVKYDPLKDAIRPVVKDVVGEDGRVERWMHADGTSLGADNGIGLSMALAILQDDTLVHGPLEVLTTTNEEDGMTGAQALPADFIRGRKVINLDSEAYDEITTGAAGALMQIAHLPYRKVPMPSDYVAYTVSVTGGQGGHSGVDIGRNRANAIKILANLLLVAIRQVNIKLYLVQFEGGQAAAAIPSQATAKVVIPKDKEDAFTLLLEQGDAAVSQQFAESDPDVVVEWERSVWHSNIISEEGTHLLLATINGTPVGPQSWREDMPGTVMTSNNIGLVTQQRDTFDVSLHTRSFSDEAMVQLGTQLRKIFELSGARVELVMQAPAWQERSDSTLLSLTERTFADVLGFRPRRVAMHFVLEAGYLVSTFPGLEIASIGPRILEPHSVNERVQVSTIDDIWLVTVELLKRLAGDAQ